MRCRLPGLEAVSRTEHASPWERVYRKQFGHVIWYLSLIIDSIIGSDQQKASKLFKMSVFVERYDFLFQRESGSRAQDSSRTTREW